MDFDREQPDLKTLAELFYPAGPTVSEELGRFTRVAPEAMPTAPRELLAHVGHMTVTMERFYRTLVDVEVLDRRIDGRRYSRKIRLRTRGESSSPGRVVQFGIVRLNLDALDPETRAEVVSERTPLGRVLIEHGVLMTVRLSALWRIEPGRDLCRALELERPTTVYGRTAMIDFENDPAIELLEVSAPTAGNDER